MKMTTEEAFVKVLQMHGIEHAFGIIGSAYMPWERPKVISIFVSTARALSASKKRSKDLLTTSREALICKVSALSITSEDVTP